MLMTLAEVIDATGGILLNPCMDLSNKVHGVTWDSRSVEKGSLFLALPGEKVDGHDYIASAVRSSAAACLVTREVTRADMAIASELECALIHVPDGMRAIRDIAAAWRDMIPATVVGITGSVGKTTTKDLVCSICSQAFRTVATFGNHNNELGVPATVLSAEKDTEVLVVEMGMRGLGQIADLCSYVKPGVGVITNIGVTHLELLGSQENIARAKGEIVSGLEPGGFALLPGDDAFTPFILDNCPVPEGVGVIRFGRGGDCDVRVTDIEVAENGACRFQLHLPGADPQTVVLSIPGEAAVDDSAAAAAVGYALGITPGDIVEGLLAARTSPMRFETSRSENGALLINDAYNANPDSMRAALTTLSGMKVPGRRIAVLGDMGELGIDEERFHREVGIFAARSNLDKLVCVGRLARHIAEAARSGGMPEDSVLAFDGVGDAVEYLREVVEPTDTVLFKASRSMGLERVVKGLGE